jgi:hypothetical protein
VVAANSLTRTGTRARHIFIVLALFISGCSFASTVLTPAPASEAPSLPAASPADPISAPDILAFLRNAQYQLGASDIPRTVQLIDGKYEEGAPGDAVHLTVTATDFAAAGDLNNDGKNEIAGLFAENNGGTGTFVFLAVFTESNGAWRFQTSIMVDDRPALNALSIENGEIFLDAIIHGAADPFCCPTLKTHRHYRLLDNGQLKMVDYNTFTPDGRPRAITINSPANGAQVQGSVQIRGGVAVAPFENTLVYRIFDAGGVEIAAGPINIAANEAGGLGTFDTIIALANILSGTVIRIEVQDLSAEDGSLLAMDSVELVVK